MRVYKIVSRDLWQEARQNRIFRGATIDLKDGYIHLSSADQAEETARLHFNGQHNLLLVAFDAAQFGESLRWETSRGGALFPHLYDAIDPTTALWEKPLPWMGEAHAFPKDWR